MKDANQIITQMLKSIKYTYFNNTADYMFIEHGKIMTDIFLKDNLHMNAKGYAIWQKIIEPYLK